MFLVHALDRIIEVPRALVEPLEPLARGVKCLRQALILRRLEVRVEDLQGCQRLGERHIVGVLICEVEEVSVLRPMDPLDLHEGEAASLHAGGLALDVVEVVEDLELVVTHIGGGLHSRLRGLAVEGELLEVVR